VPGERWVAQLGEDKRVDINMGGQEVFDKKKKEGKQSEDPKSCRKKKGPCRGSLEGKGKEGLEEGTLGGKRVLMKKCCPQGGGP